MGLQIPVVSRMHHFFTAKVFLGRYHKFLPAGILPCVQPNTYLLISGERITYNPIVVVNF